MQSSDSSFTRKSPVADFPDAPTSSCPTAKQQAHSPNAYQSHSLLKGQKTVQIVHLDQVYVLQATRQGKLILTK
jgi:hemin uptake protein HemP